MKAATAVLLLLTMTGCASSGPSGLGSSTTITPGWDRLKQVTVEAFKDPAVWAPALAGAIVQIDDMDTEISDHLREETPIFGSTENASTMSDDLRDLTKFAYISTALIVPDGAANKAKLLTAEYLAVEATSTITTEVKELAERDRPNEEDDMAFWSGHAAASSVQASLAITNIDYLSIDDTPKQFLKYSMTGSAILTSWARVEAGEHYPSDVFFGYAFGQFMGHIATAFILPDQDNMMLIPQVANDSAGVTFVLNF